MAPKLALFRLGVLHEAGRGVRSDFKKAAALYNRFIDAVDEADYGSDSDLDYSE